MECIFDDDDIKIEGALERDWKVPKRGKQGDLFKHFIKISENISAKRSSRFPWHNFYLYSSYRKLEAHLKWNLSLICVFRVPGDPFMWWLMSVDINRNGAVTEQKSSLSAVCQYLYYHLGHLSSQLVCQTQKVTNKQMAESSNLNVILREKQEKICNLFYVID